MQIWQVLLTKIDLSIRTFAATQLCMELNEINIFKN